MMLNFKKLLGFKSDLGKEIHKEFELEQRDTLFKQVDFIYNKYKVLSEKANSLDEANNLVKDLWLTIEMVMVKPEEEEEPGEMQEGMVTNGLRLQQEKEGSSSATSSTVETTSESSLDESDTAKSNDTPTTNSNSGIIVTKDVSGKYRWAGIVSNNYTDRHAEILSKEAHLDFVRAVKSGEFPYPDLMFHHQDYLTIGKADYIAYDEQSGMLMGSGYFLDEFESIGENLQTTKSVWGMSHGMPPEEIVKDKNNPRVYKRYRSTEFSLLKLNKAANPLTSFN